MKIKDIKNLGSHYDDYEVFVSTRANGSILNYGKIDELVMLENSIVFVRRENEKSISD